MITGVFYPNKDFTCLFIREKNGYWEQELNTVH